MGFFKAIFWLVVVAGGWGLFCAFVAMLFYQIADAIHSIELANVKKRNDKLRQSRVRAKRNELRKFLVFLPNYKSNRTPTQTAAIKSVLEDLRPEEVTTFDMKYCVTHTRAVFVASIFEPYLQWHYQFISPFSPIDAHPNVQSFGTMTMKDTS